MDREVASTWLMFSEIIARTWTVEEHIHVDVGLRMCRLLLLFPNDGHELLYLKTCRAFTLQI